MRIGFVALAIGLLVGCGEAPGLPAASRSLPVRAAAAATAPAGFLAAFGATGQPLTWAGAMARFGQADVVYLGEYHDDPGTHALELAALDALAAGPRKVALSLEMFETDVQALLDTYLAGKVSESEFLAGSRPWGNYRTDYRPLVEFAKAHGIPVVASNVPRRLASMVAKGGLGALAGLPDSEKRWAHIPPSCPADAYWEAFKQFGHPGQSPADLWKWYEAQCLKDETMARSIALVGGNRLVLHVNGAFHSDKALGVPPRVAKVRPGVAGLVATVRPVETAPPALPADLAGVADVALLVKGPARDWQAAPRLN
ncbi:MAG: ChaN family lipoprotein [Candidatus Sericytochromatia bacterium]|nr:ChaN family lipoprotein [Candidatus Tanganyikabacteria bacterium]